MMKLGDPVLLAPGIAIPAKYNVPTAPELPMHSSTKHSCGFQVVLLSLHASVGVGGVSTTAHISRAQAVYGVDSVQR